MSNVITFPRCRPPFLEIVAEAVDGYTHADAVERIRGHARGVPERLS